MTALRCTSKRSDGKPCQGWRVTGSTKCRRHLSNPHERAQVAVRAEVLKWGPGDVHTDPGEVLLRLVTQSAARAEHYAQLLQEAYEAAERLKRAHEARELIEVPPEKEYDEEGKPLDPPAAVQQAQADLERVFNLGAVAALVGNTYDASNGAVYATGEAIRGLAQLEATERDRCGTFAAKAVAAGLMKKQTELAAQQGRLIAQVLGAIRDDPALGLSEEQRRNMPNVARRHLGIAR